MGNEQSQGNVSIEQYSHSRPQLNSSTARANHIKVTQSLFAYSLTPTTHRRQIPHSGAASMFRVQNQ